MKLILVRHGETIENLHKIYQGHTPGILSPLGIKQAQKTALALKTIKLNATYSSDLKRTLDTTKIIQQYHSQISLQKTKLLRELSKGLFDGKLIATQSTVRKKIKVPYPSYIWPEGESLEQVQHRAVKFYQKLTTKHQNQTILVVSHGGFLALLYTYLQQQTINLRHQNEPSNCSITIINQEPNQPAKFLKLNDTSHLE